MYLNTSEWPTEVDFCLLQSGNRALAGDLCGGFEFAQGGWGGGGGGDLVL